MGEDLEDGAQVSTAGFRFPLSFIGKVHNEMSVAHVADLPCNIQIIFDMCIEYMPPAPYIGYKTKTRTRLVCQSSGKQLPPIGIGIFGNHAFIRGSTLSPIKRLNVSEALIASFIFIFSKRRFSGFIVVSHS